jgi:GWxTD domain-containing protein
MKNIFYSLIIISQILAQPDFTQRPEIIEAGSFYNSEVHYFPSGNVFTVYYSYKISYAQLFFEKKDDEFYAGIGINIEIKDSAGNFIKRISDEKKIVTKSFESTNSKNLFQQGLIICELPEGKYKLFTVISDKISKRERKIPTIDLLISKTEIILNPIVFNAGKIKCGELDSYVLSNNSSAVPFNFPNNDLVIPVSDSSIKFLTFNVKRGDTVLISNQKVTESFTVTPEMKLCDDKVIITQSYENLKVKIFLLKKFSSQLTEGPVELEVIPDDDIKKKKTFHLSVIWIGKPFALREPESAIKVLEIVEDKSIVSNLLSENGDDTQKLYSYWNQQDPTPETKFNELMNEFYLRIDYCEQNFKTIAGNGGAKSDRGKTYIKYGQPDSIDRDTNSDNKIVETWFYKETKMKFIFVDKDGTGKFPLANGQ